MQIDEKRMKKNIDIFIPELPWFVMNGLPDFDDPVNHNYRGSLIRHIAFEKAFVFLRHILRDVIGDACPLYPPLRAFNDIALGLNCNFPAEKVALYTAWMMGIYHSR